MPTTFALDLHIQFNLRQMITGAMRSNDVLGTGKPFKKRIRSGTGYGNIDAGYFRITGGTPAAPTIAASGNADFDLSGSLADVYGTTWPATTLLVALIVVNFNTAGTLSVRAASATPAPIFVGATQPGQLIRAASNADDPGIFFAYAPGGIPIAGGSTDLVNLLNNDSSNAANYAVGFAARTA